jgi:hypothetical protein
MVVQRSVAFDHAANTNLYKSHNTLAHFSVAKTTIDDLPLNPDSQACIQAVNDQFARTS